MKTNLKGKKIGRLTVIEKTGIKKLSWLCKCDCGKERTFGENQLLTRHNTSCGDIKCWTARKHGLTNTTFYRKWDAINKRCANKNYDKYEIYGGRGIRCEWKSFEEFKNDMLDSYIEHFNKYGHRNTTIDRIDSNGHYSKKNCRWATCREQSNNRRNTVFITIDNRQYPVTDLSRILGISRMKIHNLLRTRNKNDIVRMIKDKTIYD